MKKTVYFSETEAARIVALIREFENRTSAEIRIHVERRCWRSAERRAGKVFRRLGMQATVQKNGILIYLAMRSRKYAFCYDEGVRTATAPEFWQRCCEQLEENFLNENYQQGIAAVLDRVAEQLAPVFPPRADDQNELDDSISYSE